MWGTNSSPLREKCHKSEIPPDDGSPGWGCCFWQDRVSASPICLNMTLLSFTVEYLFSQFSGPFQSKLLHMQMYIFCLWEEMSSRLSFATIFNCLLPQGVFFGTVINSIKSVMSNSNGDVIFETRKGNKLLSGVLQYLLYFWTVYNCIQGLGKELIV